MACTVAVVEPDAFNTKVAPVGLPAKLLGTLGLVDIVLPVGVPSVSDLSKAPVSGP